MHWLVEPYEKNCDYLIAEIKKQGHTVDLVEYYCMAHGQELKDSNGLPYSKANYDIEECVLFQGTIQLGNWIRQNKMWRPGVWLTPSNYRCSYYYPRLQKFLFNESFVFIPRGVLRSSLNYLLPTFGVDSCLFIRPDSGLKPFSGQVFDFSDEKWEKEWSWAETFTEEEEFILVSNPKTIQEEFRFICAGGRIIAGSKYKSRHVLDCSIAVTDAAKAKCQEILDTGFAPDPIFVVDICKGMDDNHYMLELNAFSTAGLYDCDLEPIVRVASELAIKENKEYRESPEFLHL